jgi:hypothetical protein
VSKRIGRGGEEIERSTRRGRGKLQKSKKSKHIREYQSHYLDEEIEKYKTLKNKF